MRPPAKVCVQATPGYALLFSLNQARMNAPLAVVPRIHVKDLGRISRSEASRIWSAV
jgi:hypothetical protein